MTTVTVYKANTGKIKGFKVSGHTGFGEQGSDILCAGISTLVGACHLGLSKVLGLDPSFKIDEDKGYFELNLSKSQLENVCAQVLLKTFKDAAEELALNNKKFINLKIKGD